MASTDPVRVAIASPLAAYEVRLREALVRAGYTIGSATDVLCAVARLSRWLEANGMTPSELTHSAVNRFLAERRQSNRVEAVARRGLGAGLRFLREEDAIPAVDTNVDDSPIEVLLANYRTYLPMQRGLAAGSAACYVGKARKFLALLPVPLDEAVAQLNAAAVIAFVVGHAADGSVWSAKLLVTSLRSLLRYLHVEGLIPAPLAATVPGVAGWRLSALPRALRPEQVQALLAGRGVFSSAGLRDHAILTVLARLGLRGAEVAALGLRDVDWRGGQIVVRGKGSRVERLPLPADVGQALAAYVTSGRPRCSSSTLFVTARAPYRPLAPTAIRAIMARACRRAGLPRLGAHRLRHTLATELLRAGAPLAEIGQVLRHRSQRATAVYAKVYHDALRDLVQPWPGGAR